VKAYGAPDKNSGATDSPSSEPSILWRQEEATQLNMNDIASVEFEAHVPLFFDSYNNNRITGSFILIDELSNATVGAGMIEEAASDGQRVEVAGA